MIYRALVELAEREDLLQDTSYEPKPVHYLLVLSSTGDLLEILEPRDPPRLDKKGKPFGRAVPVVRQIPRRSDRTYQPRAEFLVDKAEYVFGIDPGPRPRDREELAVRHQLFRDDVNAASLAIPTSRGLRALCAFLQRDPPNSVRALLTADSDADRIALAGSLFAFVYQPDGGTACIHDEPAVKAYFKQRLDSEDSHLIGQCLVTGRPDAVLTRLHAKPRGIPPKGTTKGGVPLTSVNAQSFKSYGLDEVGCAPISREAHFAIEFALNRLLDAAYPAPHGGTFPRQNVQISPDTVVLYWTRQEAALDFMSLIDSTDPEEVGRQIRSPYKEFAAPIEDPTAFFALILSGATGRGIVRSFLQTTVRDVVRCLDRYRQEAAIVRPFSRAPGGFGLQDIRRSLVARDDLDFLPPSLGTDLYLRILDGRPFPRTILDAAVRRNRAGDLESNRLAPRISLLKAYFIRNEKEAISVALDLDRKDCPYRLGRLLATLDKIQQEALEGVNATIVDRYFGAASSTPAAVFPTLLRRVQSHLGKLRREKAGLAVTRERLVQEIVSDLDSFPATLDLTAQGMFALGYYHQRLDFFTKKAED